MLPLFLLRISGNGGLFRVPANEIYRDPKTRAAIIRVSRLSSLSSSCYKTKIPIFIIWCQLFSPTRKCRFASTFQPLQDMRAERNRQNKYFRCIKSTVLKSGWWRRKEEVAEVLRFHILSFSQIQEVSVRVWYPSYRSRLINNEKFHTLQ